MSSTCSEGALMMMILMMNVLCLCLSYSEFLLGSMCSLMCLSRSQLTHIHVNIYIYIYMKSRDAMVCFVVEGVDVPFPPTVSEMAKDGAGYDSQMRSDD